MAKKMDHSVFEDRINSILQGAKVASAVTQSPKYPVEKSDPVVFDYGHAHTRSSSSLYSRESVQQRLSEMNESQNVDYRSAQSNNPLFSSQTKSGFYGLERSGVSSFDSGISSSYGTQNTTATSQSKPGVPLVPKSILKKPIPTITSSPDSTMFDVLSPFSQGPTSSNKQDQRRPVGNRTLSHISSGPPIVTMQSRATPAVTYPTHLYTGQANSNQLDEIGESKMVQSKNAGTRKRTSPLTEVSLDEFKGGNPWGDSTKSNSLSLIGLAYTDPGKSESDVTLASKYRIVDEDYSKPFYQASVNATDVNVPVQQANMYVPVKQAPAVQQSLSDYRHPTPQNIGQKNAPGRRMSNLIQIPFGGTSQGVASMPPSVAQIPGYASEKSVSTSKRPYQSVPPPYRNLPSTKREDIYSQSSYSSGFEMAVNKELSKINTDAISYFVQAIRARERRNYTRSRPMVTRGTRATSVERRRPKARSRSRSRSQSKKIRNHSAGQNVCSVSRGRRSRSVSKERKSRSHSRSRTTRSHSGGHTNQSHSGGRTTRSHSRGHSSGQQTSRNQSTSQSMKTSTIKQTEKSIPAPKKVSKSSEMGSTKTKASPKKVDNSTSETNTKKRDIKKVFPARVANIIPEEKEPDVKIQINLLNKGKMTDEDSKNKGGMGTGKVKPELSEMAKQLMAKVEAKKQKDKLDEAKKAKIIEDAKKAKIKEAKTAMITEDAQKAKIIEVEKPKSTESVVLTKPTEMVKKSSENVKVSEPTKPKHVYDEKAVQVGEPGEIETKITVGKLTLTCPVVSSSDPIVKKEEVDDAIIKACDWISEFTPKRHKIPKDFFRQVHEDCLQDIGNSLSEDLPLGWILVQHESGVPVYMHTESKICTITKPYFIGPAIPEMHNIPVFTVPCLQYRQNLDIHLFDSYRKLQIPTPPPSPKTEQIVSKSADTAASSKPKTAVTATVPQKSSVPSKESKDQRSASMGTDGRSSENRPKSSHTHHHVDGRDNRTRSLSRSNSSHRNDGKRQSVSSATNTRLSDGDRQTGRFHQQDHSSRSQQRSYSSSRGKIDSKTSSSPHKKELYEHHRDGSKHGDRSDRRSQHSSRSHNHSTSSSHRVNERDRSSGNKKQPQTRNEDKTKISSNVSKNVKQVKTQVSPKSKIVQSVSSCATNYMAEIEDVSSDGISDVSEGYDVMDVEDISSDDLDLGEDDDGDGEPDFESEMMAAFAAYQDELGDGYSVVSDEEMEINDSENDACNIDTKTDKTDKDLKQKEGDIKDDTETEAKDSQTEGDAGKTIPVDSETRPTKDGTEAVVSGTTDVAGGAKAVDHRNLTSMKTDASKSISTTKVQKGLPSEKSEKPATAKDQKGVPTEEPKKPVIAKDQKGVPTKESEKLAAAKDQKGFVTEESAKPTTVKAQKANPTKEPVKPTIAEDQKDIHAQESEKPAAAENQKALPTKESEKPIEEQKCIATEVSADGEYDPKLTENEATPAETKRPELRMTTRSARLSVGPAKTIVLAKSKKGIKSKNVLDVNQTALVAESADENKIDQPMDTSAAPKCDTFSEPKEAQQPEAEKIGTVLKQTVETPSEVSNKQPESKSDNSEMSEQVDDKQLNEKQTEAQKQPLSVGKKATEKSNSSISMVVDETPKTAVLMQTAKTTETPTKKSGPLKTTTVKKTMAKPVVAPTPDSKLPGKPSPAKTDGPATEPTTNVASKMPARKPAQAIVPKASIAQPTSKQVTNESKENDAQVAKPTKATSEASDSSNSQSQAVRKTATQVATPVQSITAIDKSSVIKQPEQIKVAPTKTVLAAAGNRLAQMLTNTVKKSEASGPKGVQEPPVIKAEKTVDSKQFPSMVGSCVQPKTIEKATSTDPVESLKEERPEDKVLDLPVFDHEFLKRYLARLFLFHDEVLPQRLFWNNRQLLLQLQNKKQTDTKPDEVKEELKPKLTVKQEPGTIPMEGVEASNVQTKVEPKVQGQPKTGVKPKPEVKKEDEDGEGLPVDRLKKYVHKHMTDKGLHFLIQQKGDNKVSCSAVLGKTHQAVEIASTAEKAKQHAAYVLLCQILPEKYKMEDKGRFVNKPSKPMEISQSRHSRNVSSQEKKQLPLPAVNKVPTKVEPKNEPASPSLKRAGSPPLVVPPAKVIKSENAEDEQTQKPTASLIDQALRSRLADPHVKIEKLVIDDPLIFPLCLKQKRMTPLRILTAYFEKNSIAEDKVEWEFSQFDKERLPEHTLTLTVGKPVPQWSVKVSCRSKIQGKQKASSTLLKHAESNVRERTSVACHRLDPPSEEAFYSMLNLTSETD
ncbi:hypothetical protein ScPMuIL_007196 [Solemya velum]